MLNKSWRKVGLGSPIRSRIWGLGRPAAFPEMANHTFHSDMKGPLRHPTPSGQRKPEAIYVDHIQKRLNMTEWTHSLPFVRTGLVVD